MGTVLREVAALFPELNFETVYVEIQVEEANHYSQYGIKQVELVL